MKLLFIANRAYAISSSRRDIIREVLAAGHEVYVLSTIDEYSQELADLGCTCAEIGIRRGGFSFGSDILSFFRIIRQLVGIRPDVVHAFHAKPIAAIAFCSLIFRWCVLVTITGLGESLPQKGLSARLNAGIYRLACRRAHYTIFQNSDDRREFLDRGFVRRERAMLICSSGVDVEKFQPSKTLNEPLRVLFMSRLIRKKGVLEFVEAAKLLVERFGSRIRFELAGEWAHGHPDAISAEELDRANVNGAVHFLGYCRSPERWLPGALCFVCPSTYREGVPRVVLEASACGVPVIGTNVAGIRDVINSGVDGVLIDSPNSATIVSTVGWLVENSDKARKMSVSARKKMVSDFRAEEIRDRYIDLYRALGVDIPSRKLPLGADGYMSDV